MNNSENFKLVWWGILVIVMGVYLFGRYDALIEGKPSYFDTVVFIVWVGVCLAPIFKEMNLFGMKLKQDIDDLKKDMNYQFNMMKTEIKSSIEVSSANNNQIYVGSSPIPPEDSEIADIKQTLDDVLHRMGIATENNNNVMQFDVNNLPVDMFKVRFSFEKLLRDNLSSYSEKNRPTPIGKMLNNLISMGVSKDIVFGVKEVISICNYGIHGEELTETQIDFVQESAPSLLTALKNELRKAI
ncbi:hypothetical protein BIT28_27780 [Photobacterium proteolyticum]|uniref:DUF4145 domain-containing protein n=1 Tax=Photobacterium proteolyticum TaxID=1903952 RepID=A0A1Q9H7F4_9GAMM|nr:hypothetical protein [Photobacterium proteolyticum]OLQ83749.1 hypothetical protein BIT28_27780 [Photobacterium proteolyticum]